MKYRSFQEKDFDDIKLLCEKNNIDLPHRNSFVIVAENNNGQIVGFGSIANLAFIEPLISDNPVVAVNLYNQLLGVAMNQGIKELYCYCNEEREEVFNKVGFEKFQAEKLILRKEL